MRIRPAAPEDAGPIAEIHVAAWQAAYRGLMPDSYLDQLTVEKRTALWQRSLAQPSPGTMMVAENQESLAGFCLFGPTRDPEGKDQGVGEIVALNVRPSYWRSGFGRALCERACRFYEALGFLLDGADRIETSLTGAPIHELRYRKFAGTQA